MIFLENVDGLLSGKAGNDDNEFCPWCLGDGSAESVLRAFGTVLWDLSDLGYDAEWETLPASATGAPHRRNRVFILAWRRDSSAGNA
jgi:DNA (cytosine-5)-methyltransferase 1